MKDKKVNAIVLKYYGIMLKHLSSLPKKSKILDAGCGKGDLTQELFKMELSIFACDIDKKTFAYKNILFNFFDFIHNLVTLNNSRSKKIV